MVVNYDDRYNPGDYVVVKTDLSCDEEYEVSTSFTRKDKVYSNMLQHQGKKAKVLAINFVGNRFYLDITGEQCDWNSAMVIPYNPLFEKLKEFLKC